MSTSSDDISDAERPGEEVTGSRISDTILRKEGVQILSQLERDYKHDLAVHLYSTFLMHQLNKNFPENLWANWPLRNDLVPDPKTTELYTDEPESMEPKEIQGIPISPIEGEDEGEDGQVNQQNESQEVLEEDDIEGNENKSESPRTLNQEFHTRSDPTKCLKIELERMLKHKIYHHIHDYNRTNSKYYVQPSLELPKLQEQLSGIVHEKITKKIDDLMHCFPNGVKASRNTTRGIYDWKDLISNSGVSSEKLTNNAENIFVKAAARTLHEFSNQFVDNDSDDESDEDYSKGNEAGEKMEGDNNSSEENESENNEENEQNGSIKIRNKQCASNSEYGENARVTFMLRKQVASKLYENSKKRKVETDSSYFDSLLLDAPGYKRKFIRRAGPQYR